ncbi:MAG: alpha-ketoacid dehydrogenase subunit beta [Gammaproteobacteria bacterium CG_4_10_14_0_8_um_filter_38_16]|nr:MAG: alpha-ketoacid dehydrogenase subunit beta [Gammaproteobacteria bacterium CG_4_10_14_0_8_um_filter_38_16]PJA04106.1 MAG: alpha-ketoacid dehydrogenase subunit beta [Gammaproteobacteria bacterium CG_4_10_14_0_2_um_filter_38_22]PJB10028.1 MAG: alpha-ketoacid dehydrogenase subunit beta [Gammaproteobacteria bacterium CG_4_9_14_3_um_filter_38_9]
MRQLTYTAAINEAMHIAMKTDDKLLCYGLGTDDPKNIFGTTLDLQKKFGAHRVFDMPTSENAMTGVAVGLALGGYPSVMSHQRLDFFLLAMDQLVNSAAKWHYMFGGQYNVPIVIRLILGRGWGQGPTHSQNLQSWFAHIPGLKVISPTSAYDAKGLLLSSIRDPNPIVFLEHRWLHNSVSEVPDLDYEIPIGKAKVVQQGTDISLVGMSYMTVEAMRAAAYLSQFNVNCEVIDIRTIRPLDVDTIFDSVRKTKRILALDTSQPMCSVASEIISRVSGHLFSQLKSAPQLIANPDNPEPTSFGLTKYYHPTAGDIVARVASMLAIKIPAMPESMRPHDVPGDWFKGPF